MLRNLLSPESPDGPPEQLRRRLETKIDKVKVVQRIIFCHPSKVIDAGPIIVCGGRPGKWPSISRLVFTFVCLNPYNSRRRAGPFVP